MYACSKCGKVYKHNGKWLKRHMVEVCHVRFLTPNELVPRNSIDLSDILKRLEYIESLVLNGKITPKYSDDPIERIKQEEAEKMTDPFLVEYRKAFKECITELKVVLRSRKEKIELDTTDLELVRE